MILRSTLAGFQTGALVTILALLFFPHFYGHAYELVVFPALGLVVGAVLGALVRLFRWRPSRSPAGRRLAWIAVASVVLPVLAYAVRTPARHWRVSPEMVMLCIDGGTWDIVDPMIERGELPALARLKREGTAGVLRSTEPSFTPIVWTTIATGVEPETHGITSFYSTQDQLRSKRIWDVLEEEGRSVGLFRWLVTWPPHVTDGFIIPDILAHDAQCFPEKYNFVNQLRIDRKAGHETGTWNQVVTVWRFLRSGLRMETCLAVANELARAARGRDYADFHIAARRIEIRLNADVYCHLLREFRPEFTCFYDNGADVLCHYYWQYFQPELFDDVEEDGIRRYGSAIQDYYRLNDAVFGRIVDHLAPTSTVVVVSDHGHTADTGSHLNFYPRADPVLEALAMDDDYYGIALGSKTFIESVHTDPAERDAALRRAVERLGAVTVAGAGTPVFTASIYDADRVLLQPSPELSTLDGRADTPGGSVPLEQWFISKAMSGTHAPEGVYLFRGPAFRGGAEGPEATLVDVAPTVLYLAGLPLSREFAGQVLWDALDEDYRADHGVAWVDSYGRFDSLRRDLELDEATRKKLKSLGYIR